MYNKVYRKREHYEVIDDKEMEWLFNELHSYEGYLVFGAGRYASAVIKCLNSIDENFHLVGIAVTKTESNVSQLMGAPVRQTAEYMDKKELPILIATMEDFQEKIFNQLLDYGFKKIIPISQLHINRLGELYFKKQFKKLGLDLGVLDLMNLKRINRDYYQNRFNNMCDLFGNLKVAMYKKATEESAEFIIENMLDAKCYDTRTPMHYEVCTRAKEGLYLEFGVASGSSINPFADWKPDQTIYGFDCFEGLPEDWNVAATGYGKGSIIQNQLPEVRDNVKLVVGLFEDTLPQFLEEHKENIAFLHIDCDLYSAAKYVLESVHDRLIPGTEIIFDEFFNYPGWKKNSEYTAFVEVTEKYGIKYEYTGFAAEACQVAVRIIE